LASFYFGLIHSVKQYFCQLCLKLKKYKEWGEVFSMFNECNVTYIMNRIGADTFQNKSDWCIIINYFECFLKKKYKNKYTINAYLKDVKQYIDWYSSINMDKCFIFNKKSFSKYEYYLQSVKKYKKSTITYKKVALHKVENFSIEFNQQNSNGEFRNHPKTNRRQYNYLSESYIKL